ncbi:MAG: hypothetical protein K5664_00015 [Firmicutes bacterium]|nr:hypothetical protein [Bacillota bacterium]
MDGEKRTVIASNPLSNKIVCEYGICTFFPVLRSICTLDEAMNGKMHITILLVRQNKYSGLLISLIKLDTDKK